MKTFVNVVGAMLLVLVRVVAQAPNPAVPSAIADSKKDQYVALGEPIEMLAPRYPKHALKEHIQGDVVLRISVSTGGQVRDISPISGDPELAETATNAVRYWKFVPYYQNDRPAEALAKVAIVFKIDDTGRPEVSAMYDAPRPPPDNPVR
jgi:periplasmic protein TonB